MSTKRSKHYFLDSIRYHQWAPDPLGSSKPPVPFAPPNGDGLNTSKPEPRTPPNTPPTSNSSSQNRGDALSGFQSGQFNPSNPANPNPTQNRTRPAGPSGRSLPQQDNDSSHLSDRPLERSSQIFHEHAPQKIYAYEGREVVVLRNQATVEPQIQNAPVASETIGLMNTNHVIESLMLHLQPMLSNNTSIMLGRSLQALLTSIGSPSIQKMPFVFKSSDSPQSNQRPVLISKNAPSNVSVDISKNRNAVEGHNDLSRTSADLKATFSQSQTLNSQQSQMIRQAVTTFLSKQLGVSTEQLHPMISQLNFDHMSTSQKEILIQFFKIVVAAQETHFQLPQSIFQGMIQSIQWPIMQGLHEMFAPFLRLFFGPMNLFQPQQTQLNLFPTRLMEELGALMSIRTRRERRKNKKRPLKTEKVTGKTSSSLVDILHEEAEDEDSIFHNIDAWLNPSCRSDATSFMWQ